MLSFVVLFALFSISLAAFDTNCGGSYANGTYVDLSSLAGTYYINNATFASDTPVSYLPSQPPGGVTMEVAICGVVQSMMTGCTSGSASNWLNQTRCISTGRANVAGWVPNPSGNGINLLYYNGDIVNEVSEYTTRIYFLCGPTSNLTYRFYNPNTSSFHFRMYSPAVCAAQGSAAPLYVAPVVPCTTTFKGETIDLSPLKAANGSYVFMNVDGNPNVTFEIQLCGPVVTNFPSLCKTPSAANLINGSTCTSVGDAAVTAILENPHSHAGVGLVYHHGATVLPAGTLSTRVYFECKYIQPNSPFPLPNDTLVYEHFTPTAGNGGQYHLVLETAYTCPPSLIPSIPATTTTSSAMRAIPLASALLALLSIVL